MLRCAACASGCSATSGDTGTTSRARPSSRHAGAERGRAEVLPELRDLAGLWSAAEPDERRRIAEVHALGAARSSPRPPSTPSHSA